MPDQSRIVAPYYKPRTVRFEDGTVVSPPEHWALLPPGDAGLTRRVKAAGPTWTVKQKKGRREFSHGVWASAETIEAERARVEAERETPEYQRKLEAGRARRDREQAAYVEEFRASVLEFLDFHEDYVEVAQRLAEAVTAHAVPVGSGTVARTKRISVERRAEAAVIAWMRHQTTAYDNMKIARVKGRRREVRGELAKRSRELLDAYRSGVGRDATCPLRVGLEPNE
jgi:hypothetical protein